MNRWLMSILILILLTACAQKPIAQNESPVPIDSMDWVRLYDSLEELIDASELILIAHVQSSETVPVQELVFTDQTLRVERVLKGDLKPDQSVVLRRTGGTFEDRTTRDLQGEPLLENDTTYVLFLTNYADEGDIFVTTGAFQGSAVLQKDGTLRAQVSYDDPILKQFDAMTLDSLIRRIK